jgi:thiol-disulfide isomerase/thioredoxin
MNFSYIYLSIFFLWFSSSWSYTIEDEDESPWIKTKYLTRSNWTSSLKSNINSSKLHHPVWFIFSYLTYCGHCRAVKPGWEAAAQYASGKEFLLLPR